MKKTLFITTFLLLLIIPFSALFSQISSVSSGYGSEVIYENESGIFQYEDTGWIYYDRGPGDYSIKFEFTPDIIVGGKSGTLPAITSNVLIQIKNESGQLISSNYYNVEVCEVNQISIGVNEHSDVHSCIISLPGGNNLPDVIHNIKITVLRYAHID